jgi:hypothetical protein
LNYGLQQTNVKKGKYRMKIKTFAFLCVGALSQLYAAVPDRDWPSVTPVPILDVPMRDTAICRSPSGEYYLTGTIGIDRKSEDGAQKSANTVSQVKPSTPDHDFENNRELRLWHSRDLKTWQDLGAVYEIETSANLQGDGSWQCYMRFLPERPEGKRFARGIKEPEIHYVRGNWWLCFSINGEGTGLAKSVTGKPEGPYRHHARISERGAHPSMFEDDDGSVYWLMDGGWIARLNADLTALAERPWLIQPAPDPRYSSKSGGLKTLATFRFSDEPRAVGDHGAFLFKQDGGYYLTAGQRTKRLLADCDDTFIAYADKLAGPWSERFLMIPHGGGVTVFEGPKNSLVTEHRGRYDAKEKKHLNGPQLYATFSGNDERAIFRDRPSFIPLEWMGPKRWTVGFFKHAESYPRKPQAVFTMGGPWAFMKPLSNINGLVRDNAVCLAPDGYYYHGGALMAEPRELYLHRSKDLMNWEKIGPLWTYEQVPWHKNPIPASEKDNPKLRGAQVFWAMRLYHLDGRYHIVFGQDGFGLLRSKTDSVSGPYELIGKVGEQVGDDPDFAFFKSEFIRGPKGELLANCYKNWKPHLAIAEPSSPQWKMTARPIDSGAGNVRHHDDYGMVRHIEGLYVHTVFTSSCPQPNWFGGIGGSHYSNMADAAYAVGSTPWGPFRNYKEVYGIEYTEVFKDKEGQWWATIFGDTQAAPWWERPGLVPLNVKRHGDDLTIEVQPSGFSERQLKIMGGGVIAEVKTVKDILP